MESKGKRLRYVSEENFTSSEEDSSDELHFQSKNENNFKESSQRRKTRCLSRNALMARENRLKKKMYVNKLENEVASIKTDNKKLTTIVRNQSLLIEGLKKEVSYLKSIIANSSDIKNLVRNIHSSTGMSVSSSLDTNLSIRNVSVPKKNLAEPEPVFSTSNIFDDDLNLNLNLYEDVILPLDDDIFNENISPCTLSMEEHNYTAPKDCLENVGVCLHVSKHKVSLEFCSECSTKAQESWNQL